MKLEKDVEGQMIGQAQFSKRLEENNPTLFALFGASNQSLKEEPIKAAYGFYKATFLEMRKSLSGLHDLIYQLESLSMHSEDSFLTIQRLGNGFVDLVNDSVAFGNEVTRAQSNRLNI